MLSEAQAFNMLYTFKAKLENPTLTSNLTPLHLFSIQLFLYFAQLQFALQNL